MSINIELSMNCVIYFALCIPQSSCLWFRALAVRYLADKRSSVSFVVVSSYLGGFLPSKFFAIEFLPTDIAKTVFHLRFYFARFFRATIFSFDILQAKFLPRVSVRRIFCSWTLPWRVLLCGLLHHSWILCRRFFCSQMFCRNTFQS